MRKFTLLLVAILFFVGCDNQDKTTFVAKNSSQFSINEEINLKSVTGKSITLVRTNSGFKLKDSDKILLIDIFGTYCAPCQAEAPSLTEFQIKNSDKFVMIGLTHFENVTDSFVIENFIKKFNAYYFISNDSQTNQRLVTQIEKDIKYDHAIALPFKVVYKNGIAQMLTNNEGGGMRNFYIGKVGVKLLQDDLDRLLQ